jgi:hypothetical protein
MRMSTGRFIIVEGASYDNVEDGNKDNQCKGVKVGENVVGKTMRAHRCSLRRKVVTQLVICQPYYRSGIVR